jgi:hypothetical protein
VRQEAEDVRRVATPSATVAAMRPVDEPQRMNPDVGALVAAVAVTSLWPDDWRTPSS